MLGKIENMKRLYISNITSVFKCLQQLALDVIYFVVKIFKSMHCLNVIHIKLFFFMVSPFISFFFFLFWFHLRADYNEHDLGAYKC